MTLPTQEHKELLMPMTTSISQPIENLTIAATPGSSEAKIIFAEFSAVSSYPVPEGYVNIDDLISQAEEDEDFSERLNDARKLLAEKMYKENSVTSLRLKKGWSQRTLAEKLGTSQSHISKIESGREDLRLSTIQKLANVFNIDDAEIMKVLPKL